MIKIAFVSFWGDFNNNNNFIINLFNKYNINYEITKIKNANILFVGPFINKITYNIIINFDKKKIYYASEPIDINKYVIKLFEMNSFNFIFGSIEENHNMNYYKYPLYIMYLYASGHTINNIDTNNIFINVNNKIIKECDNLEKKNFCVLINRHDKFNTRTNIFNSLKNIHNIDCPSLLFNNCSNEELNLIGNVKYINKYLFNLCPENKSCKINGYITEKLLNCCLSTSIPIYFGSFDDIDEKIFNKKRIIFYNPQDRQSIDNTTLFVKELYEDKNKYKEFFKQEIFTHTAMETIMNLELKLIEKIKTYID